MPRTVLAFGTFDRVHAGHLAFLERARALGDRLVVGVARDSHVRTLKNKEPKLTEEVRRAGVVEVSGVDEAVFCDEALGCYGIIERVRPDVIVFGYDQTALEADIRRWLETHPYPIELVRIAHKEADVALGLVERDGKLLLLQRKDKRAEWDRKWEFPGGKINLGEEPEAAVRRELAEETGLALGDVTFLGNHTHDWHLPEHVMRVNLHCFRCASSEGEPVLEDHAAYTHVWVTPAEALAYDMLAANVDLLKRFYASDLGGN